MDIRETEEAVYVRIIDYKSGKTTFQLLNLYYGQQLQLVVYLNAAMAQLKKEHPGKKIVPAGIFYYRMDDPMVEADGEDEEKIMEHILGELRLNGLVSLEREAYEQMDVGLQGKSEVIPLTLNKDGSVSKRGTSGAAPVDFAALTAFVNRKICRAAEQILKGDIDIRPYQMESKTGCEHCPYHSVCGFVQKWKDIRFRKIKNYPRMKCGRISTGKEAIPMSVKWTEEQEKVIQLRNLEPSGIAAAGSGKTGGTGAAYYFYGDR